MTKNPFINALAGIAYIAIIASVMFYGARNAEAEDSVLAPIALLSLFSLSAALMGYFFLYQPLQLYLDGKKKLATSLFTQTLLVFAGITAVILTLFLSGIIG